MRDRSAMREIVTGVQQIREIQLTVGNTVDSLLVVRGTTSKRHLIHNVKRDEEFTRPWSARRRRRLTLPKSVLNTHWPVADIVVSSGCWR